MNQGMQGTVVYGNTTSRPGALHRAGAALLVAVGANGGNIVNAGGSSNTNTSIWLIGWGQNTCHGLFPKGSKAGLQVRDLGEVPLYDANNNTYQGYRTHFKWDCGLTVRDWRFVVRIANINVTAGAVTTSNLVNTLITAVNKLPFVSAAGNSPPPGGTKPGQVNTAFYCNRTVRAALDIQAMAKTNNFLTIETRDSKPYTAFRGIPIRICDQIAQCGRQRLVGRLRWPPRPAAPRLTGASPAGRERDESHTAPSLFGGRSSCSSTNRTSSRPTPATARPAPARPRRPTSSTSASPATSAAP